MAFLYIVSMDATFSSLLVQIESIDTSGAVRIGTYESLLRLLLGCDPNTVSAVTAAEGAPQRVLQVVRADIRSHEVGIVLSSLSMLSWLVSGQLGQIVPIDQCTDVFDCVTHHLRGAHYNCVLLSLFVVAKNIVCPLRHGAAAEICSLCSDIILLQHRRDTMCNTTGTTSDTSQREQKLLVWAYKALLNAWWGSDSPNQIQLRGELLLTTFNAILTTLRAKPNLLDFPDTAHTDDETADADLVLAQIKLLLEFPLARGLVCLLHIAVASCKQIAGIICGALKKATVSEETVYRYCQVWSAWLKISTELLVPANFEVVDGRPTVANNEVLQRYKSSSEARDAFWNLLAPKNGVGELTTSLQFILKRSRLQAARCYKSIASSLVVAKDWHEPSAVLKLLLRCLFHLLFSSAPVAASGFPIKSSTTAADGIIEQCLPSDAQIESELSNVGALQVAGEALCILCCNIQRARIDEVLQISVSMGRPAATPQARSATKQAAAAGATSPRTAPGVANAELTSAVMTTPAAKAPPPGTERASLDVIIRKLLVCSDPRVALDEGTAAGSNELARAAAILVALQNVTSGISATAALLTAPSTTVTAAEDTRHSASHSTSVGESSTVAHVYIPRDHMARPRSNSRSAGFSKGLFASPAKTYVKATRRSENQASTGVRLEMQDVVTCASIFGHFQLLMSAMVGAACANELVDSALNANTVFVTLLEKSGVKHEHNMHHLCHAWQSCTVALAQALFDELAASAEVARTGDDNIHESAAPHAPKYQSTQLEAFSLLFSAPTQASQLFYTGSKRSPHRFSIPSQSSQPLYVRLRQQQQESSLQLQYQLQQSEVAASGRDGGNLPPDSAPMEPASQIVLCSAHPPAVQATVELCGLIIKVWREIWMGTAAGRREHKARGIFIESFWWFLHRTTGFNVDVNSADFDALCETVQERQPFLSTEHCPDNMTGVVLLMTLSHACLSTTTDTTPKTPAHTSMNIIHRALHQCMNSMTESGVLPPLFTWIPSILARLQSARDPNKSTPATSAVREAHSAGVIAIRCNVDQDEANGQGGGNACVLILTSFLQRSLQQLSSMTVPTASEQHSPALMHSMIGGLKHLLTAPLIICIGGGKGIGALLEDHSASSVATALQTESHPSTVPLVRLLEPGNKVIANWRSILSLWLELKEFAVHHYAEGGLDAAQSGDPSIAWVDAILASNHSRIHTVPFVADTTPPTDLACVMQRLQELYATLSLIQAGVDSSLQHRRKHPQSSLTSSLALTLLSLLVSSSCALRAMFCSQGDSAGAVEMVYVNNVKAIDTIIARYLTVFPPLLTHVTELLAESPKYSFGSTAVGPSEAVFAHLLQAVATMHGFASRRGVTSTLMIHVKPWALSVLSSLCAINTAINNSMRGFRSAVVRLAAGASVRQVVKDFAAALAQPVDAELQEIILAAWRELGGVDSELTSLFGEPAVSSTANPVASPPQSGAKLSAPAKDTPSAGLKRSFIPAAAALVQASDVTPAKVPRNDATTDAQAPGSGGFLRVAVPAMELAALAQKANAGLNARQGFVPATYTGADRANLDQQSQQASQLHSQLASQAQSQHQSQHQQEHASEPAAQPSQSVWPEMSPPKPPPLSYTTARTHVSQHSDSTTYVSPTPGTHSAHPVSQQRRQIVPPSLPMSLPMELCAEDPAVVESNEDHGQAEHEGHEGEVAAENVSEQAAEVNNIQPTVREVLQDLVAATVDGVVQSDGSESSFHTALQDAYSGISRAVDELSAHLQLPAAQQGPPAGVDPEQLSAAIRQSHRLTGLLLELLSQQQANNADK